MIWLSISIKTYSMLNIDMYDSIQYNFEEIWASEVIYDFGIVNIGKIYL